LTPVVVVPCEQPGQLVGYRKKNQSAFMNINLGGVCVYAHSRRRSNNLFVALCISAPDLIACAYSCARGFVERARKILFWLSTRPWISPRWMSMTTSLSVTSTVHPNAALMRSSRIVANGWK
jgi:hypothetical protein